MDSSRTTAELPFESMQAAPNTSFEENGNPGSAPRYQRSSKIEMSCRNLRSALFAWRSCEEEFNFEFRHKLEQENLPNQIGRLNCMHRELCGIDHLISVADGIDLFVPDRPFWPVRIMHRPAPSAIAIQLQTSRKSVEQMHRYLRTEHPPLGTRLI